MTLSGLSKYLRRILRPKIKPVYIPVLHSNLLAGRRALITGGTSGIGFSIAKAFALSGATVVVAGRDEGRLSKAVETINNSGGKALGIKLDVSNIAQLSSNMDGAGEIDILVNNAGFVGGSGFGGVSEHEYDMVMDTNLKGVLFVSQIVSERWIAKGIKGNILNICSASSLRPGTSPYILSKWGLRSLTLGMAKKLVSHGIVVNGLAPGIVNTSKFANGGDDISHPKNPSGRMVTQEEVANLAVIMVSSLCRMVVGDVLYVTGGGALITLDD